MNHKLSKMQRVDGFWLNLQKHDNAMASGRQLPPFPPFFALTP
jgi:hypothetical protein